MSRNLEYALMALQCLSNTERPCVSAREMAQSLHCPFDPLSRALQKMADHKIIDSKQGVQGGYFLIKDLKTISLYQLISAILEPPEIAACLSGPCDLFENCNIKKPVHYLNQQFLDFYKTLKIQNILDAGIQAVKSRSKKTIPVKKQSAVKNFIKPNI